MLYDDACVELSHLYLCIKYADIIIVDINLDVPRNQTLDQIDTSIIKQQISDHQYWNNKEKEIYQTL